MNMKTFCKIIELKRNRKISEQTNKDFGGDFELCKKLMHDTYVKGDETGVMYYTYKERKDGNRVEFKGIDPSGNGFIQIMTRYE